MFDPARHDDELSGPDELRFLVAKFHPQAARDDENELILLLNEIFAGRPAADRGVGSMIMIAKNFLQTDTVVIGIIIIGLIGYGIEMLMRILERRLIPWKGKG